MKISKMKSVLGIGFLIAAGLIISQYQNCAPAGTTGAFVLNGSNTLPSTTSAPVFAVGAITLPTSTFQVGTAMTATAVVTDGGTSVTCAWSVLNSASTIVSTYSAASTTGICNLSLTAPTTAATYALVLDVTNLTTQTVTTSVGFMTQASAVTATFSASLTPSPPGGIYNSTPFTLTAQAVSNTSQIFNVVVGTVYGGVKVPIPGCTFTSTVATTTYSPACTTYFNSVGPAPLYVDVTAGGQTLDCQAVSGSCTGTYVVNVRMGGGGGGGLQP